MPVLGWYLLAVVVAAALALATHFSAGRSRSSFGRRRSDSAAIPSPYEPIEPAAYRARVPLLAITIFGAIAVFVLYGLGPLQVPREATTRLEWLGYRVPSSPNGLTLYRGPLPASDRESIALRWPQLREDTWLRVRARDGDWAVETAPGLTAFVVDGKLLNPEARVIKSGDALELFADRATLKVDLERSGDRLRVRVGDRIWRWRGEEAFRVRRFLDLSTLWQAQPAPVRDAVPDKLREALAGVRIVRTRYGTRGNGEGEYALLRDHDLLADFGVRLGGDSLRTDGRAGGFRPLNAQDGGEIRVVSGSGVWPGFRLPAPREGSLTLRFRQPVLFPLPPVTVRQDGNKSAPLLLTTGTRNTPQAAYWFDGGSSVPTTVNQLRLATDLSGGTLAYGLSREGSISGEPQRVRVNQSFAIGSQSRQLLLQLRSTQASPATWFWAIAAIGLCAIPWARFRARDDALRAALGLQVAWCGVTALLVVRFLTAIRGESAVPLPALLSGDAASFDRMGELARIAIWIPLALAILATFLLAWNDQPRRFARFRSLGPRLAEVGQTLAHRVAERTPARFQPFLPFAVLGVAALIQAIFRPLPTTVFVVICQLGVLAAITQVARLRQSNPSPPYPWATRWLLFAVACAAMVPLFDFGGILSLVPLLATLALAVPLCGGNPRFTGALYGGLAVAVLTTVVFRLVAPVLEPVLQNPGLGKLSSDLRYRVAAALPAGLDGILLAPPDAGFGETAAAVSSVARTAQQRWQMLSYAHAETVQPVAYGRADLVPAGLNYDAMVSDAVFTAFVMSEHGRFTGLMVAALYLIIVGGALLAAWHHVIERSTWFLPLLYGGVAMGFYGMYMAAANVWVGLFTGQNMPWLGLDSPTDLIWWTLVLIVMTVSALHQTPARSDGAFATQLGVSPGSGRDAFRWGAWQSWYRDHRAGTVWWGVTAVATAQWITVFGSLYFSGHDADRDYGYSPAVARHLRQSAEQLRRNPDTGNFEWREGTTPSRIAAFELQRLNDREEPTSPEGFFFSSSNRRDAVVRTAPYAVQITSPLARNRGPAWQGELRGNGVSPRPGLLVRGQTIEMRRGAGNDRLNLGRSIPANRSFEKVQFVSSRRGETANLAQFRVVGDGLEMVSNSLARAWLNGKPAPNKAIVRPGDLVVTGRAGQDERYTIFVTNPGSGALAETRWQNGAYRRIAPLGRQLPLAYGLGFLADSLARPRADGQPTLAPKQNVSISLHVPLHLALQTRLDGWVRRRGATATTDPRRTVVSMSVIDAHSGAILAVPAVPQADPDDDPASAGPLRRVQYASVSSWNMAGHVIGSTIKPMSFAALSEVFAGQAPFGPGGLASVRVPEIGAHPRLGGLDITTREGPFPGQVNPAGWTMADYLARSRTWPVIITSAIGMVPEASDVGQILRAGGRDLIVEGRGYRLNLASSPFYARGAGGGWSNDLLSDSLYFRSLRDMFGLSLPDRSETVRPDARQWEEFSARFPSLKAVARPNDAFPQPLLLPEPPTMEDKPMERTREDLISTFLGGGGQFWNNLSMSEAFARMATGRRVSARWQVPSDAAYPSVGGLLADGAWRERNLLGPLERVRTSPQGTLAGMRVNLRGYRAIFKTGTIGNVDSEDTTPDDESIAFVVGEFRNGQFAPGRTVSGYLYMEKSKMGASQRKELMARMLVPVLDYLDAKRR